MKKNKFYIVGSGVFFLLYLLMKGDKKSPKVEMLSEVVGSASELGDVSSEILEDVSSTGVLSSEVEVVNPVVEHKSSQGVGISTVSSGISTITSLETGNVGIASGGGITTNSKVSDTEALLNGLKELKSSLEGVSSTTSSGVSGDTSSGVDSSTSTGNLTSNDIDSVVGGYNDFIERENRL